MPKVYFTTTRSPKVFFDVYALLKLFRSSISKCVQFWDFARTIFILIFWDSTLHSNGKAACRCRFFSQLTVESTLTGTCRNSIQRSRQLRIQEKKIERLIHEINVVIKKRLGCSYVYFEYNYIILRERWIQIF